MCGIVGVLSAKPVDPQRVVEMRDTLVHRGPDDQGLWLAPDSRVCLGFRRLAIVDLSPEANQPFHSHDARFVIVFNGEIYNFRALREELAGRGVRFRTQSDTEVLVEAFREWGEGCLERLSGMFAFALWDQRELRLFCARDRAGEKPFYFAQLGDSFLFASELKAITRWPEFRADIHWPAMIDFLTLGFVADPKSIWENCRKLPPAHSMWVELKPGEAPRASEPRAYWDFEFQPDDSADDWGPRIRETLQAAAKEMSYADVPVGAFLSGGVDSSSVTAALAKAGCDVTAFTVGFEDPAYDERPWAREIARLYKAKHAERVVEPGDVTAAFDKLLWHYDEPFNDYSYLPTYYLCREARQVITVALSGDGGDEMFAGYTKYARLRYREDLGKVLVSPLRKLLAAGARTFFPERSLSRRTLLQYGLDAEAMLTDMLTLGFSPAEMRRWARGPLAAALRDYSPQDVVAAHLRKAPLREVGLVNAMRYLDLKLTLAGDILVKVDRASMAVSLEVRPVYLHREVMALAARIPPRVLADRRQAKKTLKSALRPWLPEQVLHRKKQGFAMPLEEWLNRDLRGLLPSNPRGGTTEHWFDSGCLAGFTPGAAPRAPGMTSRIHSVILMRNWAQKWLTDARARTDSTLPVS